LFDVHGSSSGGNLKLGLYFMLDVYGSSSRDFTFLLDVHGSSSGGYLKLGLYFMLAVYGSSSREFYFFVRCLWFFI
jgi:hypothetical protein